MLETIEVKDMIAENYEPKRKFRWVLEIDGIKKHYAKETIRPKISKVNGKMVVRNMYFEYYDPINPSVSQEIYKWMKDNDSRNGKIKILDPLGTIVETWEINGLKVEHVDFGNLDYSDKGLLTVKFICSCKEAKLL